jgi:hypothetical protein
MFYQYKPKNKTMKLKFSYILLIAVVITAFSCKKDTPASVPTITFSTFALEGTANANGEYELKGRISSATRLEQVTLTKEGQTNAFLLDNSTAKNKTE